MTEPPVVTTVTPNTGKQGEAITGIAIAGSGFTGASVVDFGPGIAVTGFSVIDDADISVDIQITDNAALGARDVSVTAPTGTGTLTSGFTVLLGDPVVNSVLPRAVARGETIASLAITGLHFTGATVVDLGAGITVNSFSVIDDNNISANITISAVATPGFRNALVTNPAGTSSPADADAFDVLGISLGAGITVNSFIIDSMNQITADVSIGGGATPGLRDVEVANGFGDGLLSDGFLVLPAGAAPIVLSATPNTGLQGETILAVTIAGSNFTGATSVSFGAGITVLGFSVDTDIQITAGIYIDPAAALGWRNVSVTNGFGTGTLIHGFTVLMGPPTIISVTPNSGLQGQILTGVQIVGTNFNNPPVTVDFGAGIVVSGVIVSSGGTLLTCDLAIDPTATPGPRTVSVDTAAGTATLVGGFTVLVCPRGFAPGILRVPMTQVIRCG